MHFGYIQDDWRVSPNLTFNLGLRYELGTPQWENNNFLTNFDPATNTLIQASDGSIYDRALVNPDRNNFAPRLGVAYSLTPKTVIRSAYGTSYIHFNRLGGENLLSFNGPHVVPIAITQQPSQGACAAGQAPTTLLPHHAGGVSAGAERAGELQPAQRPRQLHSARHEHRQRAELARHRAARAAEQPAGRRRLHRQSQPQPRHPRRLQPGAAQQRRRGRPAPGPAADPGVSVHPGGVRRRQGQLSRDAGEGGAALHARAVFPQLVHLVEGRGQCLRPPRDGQRRQQPRQFPRHRRRVGNVGLQPADQQHDDGRLGAAVRPRSPVGERPQPDSSKASSAAGA